MSQYLHYFIIQRIGKFIWKRFDLYEYVNEDE